MFGRREKHRDVHGGADAAATGGEVGKDYTGNRSSSSRVATVEGQADSEAVERDGREECERDGDGGRKVRKSGDGDKRGLPRELFPDEVLALLIGTRPEARKGQVWREWNCHEFVLTNVSTIPKQGMIVRCITPRCLFSVGEMCFFVPGEFIVDHNVVFIGVQ